MAETLNARDVKTGYHPSGYRIDKSASPMNRYTKWEVTEGGQEKWKNPQPVCFDSLPESGWIQADNFDWESATPKE